MSALTSRLRKDESGAVAVVVAIMAVLLISMAALVVDLSNAFVQKREMQKRTDFAALSGAVGDALPATGKGNTCTSGNTWSAPLATDRAIVDTAAYLNTLPEYAPTGTEVQPAQLVNCDFSDGEAAYGMWSKPDATGKRTFSVNENQLSVISQPRRVDFGFAGVMGFDGTNVAGQATVEIKSPLLNTLPFYAFTGCDYGQQTISQPTNGHSSEGVNLALSGDNTYVTFGDLTVSPASAAAPPEVALNSLTTTLNIQGTNLDKVTQLGFFQSAATNPPDPVLVPATSFTSPSATSITVTIPPEVTSQQDTWFIRLLGANHKNKTDQEWTPVADKGNANKKENLKALPIIVGNAFLTCDQGSSEGNFGTLLLFNDSPGAPNGQSDNIAYNIAAGLQHTLAPFPADKLVPDFTCGQNQDGAVLWPNEGTNCVDTKTGLEADAAFKGFIAGVSGKAGLLTNTDSDDFCPNDYPVGTTHKTVAPTGQNINNDVLTCYFTNDTITVGDVSSRTYSGGVVIDQAIYKSPRFVQVPVLGREPDKGGSSKYQIVDFRPAFLTEQPATATRLTGAPTSGNGITWTHNDKLQAVKVIFLNTDALPNPPVDDQGRYIPYVGSGKKVPLLVN